MPLGWPTPVVWPSWSLALAKPAGHTLSSINIFQTWPLYTDSYQIFHCVWMKGCSSAVVLKLLWSPLPPSPPPSQPSTKIRRPHPTSDYPIISVNIMKKKRYLWITKPVCLSVLILYFNAAKFSIKLFYLYILLFLLSVNGKNMKKWLKHPFKNT